jgi:hypothetical protein
MQTWTEREGLRALPLFAIGASSGGSFATVFARAAKLAGMFVQVGPSCGAWSGCCLRPGYH